MQVCIATASRTQKTDASTNTNDYLSIRTKIREKKKARQAWQRSRVSADKNRLYQ